VPCVRDFGFVLPRKDVVAHARAPIRVHLDLQANAALIQAHVLGTGAHVCMYALRSCSCIYR
jgi:hypothetical protein